jgi:hypothetical protein
VKNSSKFDHSVLMPSAIIKVNNNKSCVAFFNPNEFEIKVDEVSVHVESLNQFNCFHFNESGDSSNNHISNELERKQKIIENLRLEHLNLEEQKQITDICLEYSDLFTFKSEPLSETNSNSHTIPMASTQATIKVKPYRLPQAQQSEINQQVRTMLEQGAIEPSTSPWNSPLLIIPKKSDASGEKKYRIVVDFRKVNDATLGDAYPLPNITDILDQLGRSRYFTVLDLAFGFHQIPMDPKDAENTAFSTPFGHYQYRR